ncbi:hypothetical protein [Nocardioides rubriscoriae]|uniref:hypothetical protein n=1 Tax=Nocardioides rubriscoriae TaxID=642762 RepID=UPI0011DF20A7|nr:hypothetical protein [Nocardioides rubriscoriae]
MDEQANEVDLEDDVAYLCARSAGTTLGSYDGLESWTLHASLLTNADEQALVTLHERLHHELQHTTLWGLVGRFAGDLARLGIDPTRIRRLFRFSRDQARMLHETYATTLSVGVEPTWRTSLEDNTDYAAFYDAGVRLAPGRGWASDRFAIDCALRACMSAPALGEAVAVGFARVRIATLAGAESVPDLRMRQLQHLVQGGLTLPNPLGLDSVSTSDELAVYFDEVATVLEKHGLPTMHTAEVRSTIDALFEDVAALSPDLRARIELDLRGDRTLEDVEEHQRERIALHDTGPLPLEIVDVAEFSSRAADFVRHHSDVGMHILLVWARADVLARQFRRPNGLDGIDGYVCALQAAGLSETSEAVARLCIFETESPAEVARLFSTVKVVCVTTASSLMDAPGAASSKGIETIVAIMDQPVVAQFLHTFKAQARVTWARTALSGDRHLHIFSYLISALPGIVWLQVASEVGRQVTERWLATLGEDKVVASRSAFEPHMPLIDAAVQHVVAAWSVIDQRGGRRSE